MKTATVLRAIPLELLARTRCGTALNFPQVAISNADNKPQGLFKRKMYLALFGMPDNAWV